MNNKNESTLAARLRNERAFSLLMTADAAAQLVKDGMTIGVSGFTPSGYPKAVPLALAERAKKGDKFKVDIQPPLLRLQRQTQGGAAAEDLQKRLHMGWYHRGDEWDQLHLVAWPREKRSSDGSHLPHPKAAFPPCRAAGPAGRLPGRGSSGPGALRFPGPPRRS